MSGWLHRLWPGDWEASFRVPEAAPHGMGFARHRFRAYLE